MAIANLVRRLFAGRLVRTTGLTFALRVANTALNFGVAALLARYLGPHDYGRYSVVLALLTTLAIPAQFGIPALVIREVSRARADGAGWRFHDITRWAHVLTLAIGIPMLAITVLAAMLPVGLFSADETPVILAGAVLVVMLPLSGLRSGLMRGLDRVVLGQFPAQIVQPLLLLVFVVLLAFAPRSLGAASGLSPFTAMLAYSISAVVAWAVGGWVLLRLLEGVEKRPHERWVVPGWKGAILAFGLTNAMVLVDQQVGLLVLGVTSPDIEAAFFKVASQAAMFTAMGYVASNMALGPDVASKWHRGDHAAVQSAVVRGSRLSALFALPVSLFFLVAGGLFLRIAFGASYVPAWPAMALLVSGQFVNCALGSNTTLLNMSGNEKQNTYAFAIALGCNVALAFALAPRFGATGAAVAAAISVIMRNLILWRAAHRLCGIETGFWGRVPRPTAPG